MIDLTSGLGDVKVKTADALRASEADTGASGVLVAVVREFDSKARRGEPAGRRQRFGPRFRHRARTGWRQREGSGGSRSQPR